MIGFAIDASILAIKTPEATVYGAIALIGQLQETAYSGALEARNFQKIRCRIGNYGASNSMWRLVPGPILRNKDECAIWANCPILEACPAFSGSMALICKCMQKISSGDIVFGECRFACGNLINGYRPSSIGYPKLSRPIIPYGVS